MPRPNDVLILDFETYYDTEYSLKRMTPAEYILDPRYETIMCAAKVNDEPHHVVDGPDFGTFLSQFDPHTTTTITFNALFDNAILAWQYGFVPHTMIDAMAMARAIDGHRLVRFSLKAIAEHLGLQAKGTAINDVMGMRRQQIIANGLWPSFKTYAQGDNEICEQIFLHYYPKMPWSERRLMDMVLRCCVEPRFLVDTTMLENHIKDVVRAKDQLIIAAGNVDRKDIMSTAKFQAALEALGVDIQYKPSPSDPTKELPAFAKTDEFMEELQNDPDPMVAALAAARVGLKSTLEETRSGTLMRIGNLPWSTLPGGQPRLYSGGTMPIPLRYGGAHTHRLSGDWRMNMQNMPTVRGSKGKSKLRLALKAPPGHKVVTIDLGQIEARLVAWLCGAVNLLEEFAKYDQGDKTYDPYNRLASSIFGTPVNRKLTGTPDEIKGFIGKTGILGLGYGAGKDKFDGMVIRSARSMAMDISQIYNRGIGDKAVDTYRTRYSMIPRGWNVLSQAIQGAWMGKSPPVKFGPCTIGYDAGIALLTGKGEAYITLPSGLELRYGDPQEHQVKDKTGRWRIEHSYRYGKMRHRIYGAKTLENISQSLARVIVMNAALRIRDRGKGTAYPWAYRFVHQAHDELVYIVPDSELAVFKALIHKEMTRPPSWAVDLPLAADVGMGDSYGEAK
jgi:hypothetical protein